jgi:CBS domain containing-hemolysin-like protein
MTGDVAGAIAIAVLVIVGALVAAAECAIGRIGRAKAHQLAQGKPGAATRLLVKIVEDPAPYFNGLLVVTLLCLLMGTAIATGFALRAVATAPEVIAAAVMTFVVFVVAEIVPRTFALQHAERVAVTAARPVYIAGVVLRPLTRVLVLAANAVMGLIPGRALSKGPFMTDEELRETLGGVEEEQIEEEERELIHSVFEFGDTVVREVMVPRIDMIAIPGNSTLDQALDTIVGAGYSRIPIYEGDTDNITGVLYAKDLLKRLQELERDQPVSALGRAPLFVPEQKKVAELLRGMQQERIHMAIVVDEYGGTAGLVTIEDVIEEIVGEIVDEYDQEEPLVEPIDDHSLRVDAKMLIDEVNELLNVRLPHEEWDTVGGLVFGLTGRVPVAGEVVRFDSLEFRTERVTGRRIQKVVITKPAGSEDRR